MIIKDDMSYINKGLVERGLMEVVPFQIRLDRYFTAEEMKNNKLFAENHNKIEWEENCDRIREKIAAENIALMEYLEQYFTFGQYKQPYNKDYTFWFWCNNLCNITSGRLSGRDYSYITLSLDKNGDIEENERIFAKVKALLSDYPAKNIQAIFQYSQIENTDIVAAEAERIYKFCEGKFINYGGIIGKLGRFEEGYIFKKKNSKKYFYRIKPIDICVNVIA